MRSAAVHATLDVILTTLNITSTGAPGQTGDDCCLSFIDKMVFLQDELVEISEHYNAAVAAVTPVSGFSILSDRAFQIICPPCDLIFVPRNYHK